jgi:phenylalanyl-tRNA synthetase beta chain
MKVPLKWLKEYVNINLPAAEVARRLTMAGTETSLVTLGESWEGVVIGRIEAVEPHPNADRLRLVTVDTAVEKQKVVCGAPNLTIGDKIAFAAVGTELIDGYSGKKAVLKEARIRGVVSCGMVCSEKELGISDSHEGILVLPAEAPLGRPLAEFLSDTVLNLETTPNRPDLLSVTGVAHEVAALTGETVRLPEIRYDEPCPPIEGQIAVEIADPDLCPRYCASLISDIKVDESPEWLKQRLTACGMRPISNIVDITNYVMLEYGQPLHGFDYGLIKNKKIIVRRASPGRRDGYAERYRAQAGGNTLVIADERRAVAVAGVMGGGANSEMRRRTTTILLNRLTLTRPASTHQPRFEAGERIQHALRARHPPRTDCSGTAPGDSTAGRDSRRQGG